MKPKMELNGRYGSTRVMPIKTSVPPVIICPAGFGRKHGAF